MLIRDSWWHSDADKLPSYLTIYKHDSLRDQKYIIAVDNKELNTRKNIEYVQANVNKAIRKTFRTNDVHKLIMEVTGEN